jgi:hypothetical protein
MLNLLVQEVDSRLLKVKRWHWMEVIGQILFPGCFTVCEERRWAQGSPLDPWIVQPVARHCGTFLSANV